MHMYVCVTLSALLASLSFFSQRISDLQKKLKTKFNDYSVSRGQDFGISFKLTSGATVSFKFNVNATIKVCYMLYIMYSSWEFFFRNYTSLWLKTLRHPFFWPHTHKLQFPYQRTPSVNLPMCTRTNSCMLCLMVMWKFP